MMHPARPRPLPPWASCQLKAKAAGFVDLLSAMASPSPATSGSHHAFLFLLSILGLFACLFVLILCFSSLLLRSLIYHCFLLFIVLSFVLFCVLPLFSFSVFFSSPFPTTLSSFSSCYLVKPSFSLLPSHPPTLPPIHQICAKHQHCVGQFFGIGDTNRATIF